MPAWVWRDVRSVFFPLSFVLAVRRLELSPCNTHKSTNKPTMYSRYQAAHKQQFNRYTCTNK